MKSTWKASIPGLALVLAGCAGGGGTVPAPAPSPAGDAQPQRVRETPPPPEPLAPVEFPEFAERTLANGARVIIVRNAEQPVANVSVYVQSGTASDPRDRPGVASLAADLLNKGTATRDAEEIAQTIDFIGASLNTGVSDEWTNVSVTSLTGTLDTALELLSDVVVNPSFPEDDLKTLKQRQLSALQLALSQPEALAERRFTEEVFGRHPYGKLMTPQSVQVISRDDLATFHRTNYRPGNALIVVTGDVEPDAITAKLEQHFGGWRSAAVNDPTMFAPPSRQQREVVLVHKPGSVQAVMRLGHLLPPPTDPDYVPLDVAVQVLGGGMTGWLYQVLREEKGYTYGSFASALKKPDVGYFQATAEVRNEVVDSAVVELIALIDKLRTEPVPAADLELAKNFMVGSFPLGIETPQQIAGQVANTRLLGLPADYLETYRQKVAAVTAADVQRVAQKMLHPDRAVLVVVGDATQIREKLIGFGPIQMYDVDGKPLALGDIEVRASDVAIDASRLPAMQLAYNVLVQGQQFGTMTSRVTREQVENQAAVRIVSSMTSAMMNAQDDLAFNARTFTPIYSKGTQQMGPNTMGSDLRYEGGRIVGTATLPGQGEKEIDAEVPAGTLLSGMEAAAIWVSDLAATEQLKLPMFNPQTGNAANLTIEVVGEKQVTVPAGTFDTYELDIDSPEARMRAYARKEAPHVIVKQEFLGQPIVFELTDVK